MIEAHGLVKRRAKGFSLGMGQEGGPCTASTPATCTVLGRFVPGLVAWIAKS